MKNKQWSPHSQISWPGPESCTFTNQLAWSRDASIQVRDCGMRKADTVLTEASVRYWAPEGSGICLGIEHLKVGKGRKTRKGRWRLVRQALTSLSALPISSGAVPSLHGPKDSNRSALIPCSDQFQSLPPGQPLNVHMATISQLLVSGMLSLASLFSTLT